MSRHCFCDDLRVLHLEPLAPDTPRLPHRRLDALAPLLSSVSLHAALVAVLLLIEVTAAPVIASLQSREPSEQVRLVFLAPQMPTQSGGGGGGGNRQPAPIRRAQGIGTDAVTVRTRKPAPEVASRRIDPDTIAPSIVLDAKPLASGLFEQAGLPVGVMVSPSTGPGSGGGVGTGTGTGMGPGTGPGLGPGSGGGTGGGVYRAGGLVSAPRLIKEVRPKYTPNALRNKIQGTVILEAVVKSDGCPSQIRIVRSLDPGGLDEEALATVAQWRFEPGRLSGTAVDVLVTIMLDFTVR